MKHVLAVSLPLALLLGWAACSRDAPDAPASSLVAAERAFAQASQDEGMRSAFLTFLADDAIIFRPRPVNGKAYFQAQPEAPGTLAWRPTFADVSQASDMGYTTGPWTYRTDSTAAHGHYVSVWEKQPDGAWRVVIDAGISHPEAEIPDGEPEIPTREMRDAAEDFTDADREAARLYLFESDRALAEVAATEGLAAVLDAAGDSLRLYRPGALPVRDAAARRALLATTAGRTTWAPLDAAVARSGDFGYTYGLTAHHPADGSPPDSSAYLRLWQRRPDGNWALTLDLASPID